MGRAWLLAAALGLAAPAEAASQLVYSAGDGDTLQVVVAGSDGTNAKPLTTGPAAHVFPKISADGTQVAWSEGPTEMDVGVVVKRLGSGAVEEYTEAKGWNLQVAFSGNGRFLAYSTPRGAGGAAVIALVDLEAARAQSLYTDVTVQGEKHLRYTGTAKLIEEAGYGLYFPSLSSDGRLLVYERMKDEKHKDVVLRNLETDETRVLSAGYDVAMAPSFSFDDRYVVHTAGTGPGNVFDIFVEDLKGGGTTRLTDDHVQNVEPTFRPDGSVVFAAGRGEHFSLYQIDAASIRQGKPVSHLLVAGTAGDVFAPSVSGDLAVTQGLLTPMSDPARSSFGIARVGDRIYVVGGHQGHEHTYPPESFMDAVEFYDLHDGQWHAATPRPVASQGFMLAAHGKYVYAFGGFAYNEASDPTWRSLKQIDRYDTELDRWETVGELPRGRSSYVLGVVDEKVYIIGGWDSTPQHPGDDAGTFSRAIDVFDLKTEKVIPSVTEMPSPLRRALTAVTVGDEIILVGGLGEGASHLELIDNVTAYNPKTGAWRELPKLPFPTFAPATGVLGTKLYMFGGYFNILGDEYNYVNHIFTLDLAGDTAWTHVGRYLTENKGFPMVLPLDDSTLAVFGGHSYDTDDAPVKTVETFKVGK